MLSHYRSFSPGKPQAEPPLLACLIHNHKARASNVASSIVRSAAQHMTAKPGVTVCAALYTSNRICKALTCI